METTKKDLLLFEELVKNDYKIFVDTSSLMQEYSELIFFKYIAPLLHRYDKKLIVPKSVFNEISRHNINNHPLAYKANHILEQLGKYQLYGYNSKFDESFADNAIIAQFTSLRLKYNLCLITSDYSYAKDGNLSQDIIDLRKSKSTENINDIKVFNILSNKKEFKEFINYNNKKSIHTKVKENTFKFSLPKNPHRNDPSLKTNFIPSVGNYIFDNLGNNHKLEKQIGRTGGEGSVYLTNTGYICKIFKIDKKTQFRKNKIGLLIENNIKIGKRQCL